MTPDFDYIDARANGVDEQVRGAPGVSFLIEIGVVSIAARDGIAEVGQLAASATLGDEPLVVFRWRKFRSCTQQVDRELAGTRVRPLLYSGLALVERIPLASRVA